jgi:ABC-type glucose/galactose transport system permease subunit
MTNTPTPYWQLLTSSAILIIWGILELSYKINIASPCITIHGLFRHFFGDIGTIGTFVPPYSYVENF